MAITAAVAASCGTTTCAVDVIAVAANDSNQTSGETAAPQPTRRCGGARSRMDTSRCRHRLRRVDVPLDYSDPDGDTITPYVVRHSARDEGVYRFSVGEPGWSRFGGSVLAALAPQIYDDALLDRFDIVGWDPRGTGLSTPTIDCIDDYDLFSQRSISP